MFPALTERDASSGLIQTIHEAAYQGRLSRARELLAEGVCPDAPAAVGPGHRTWISAAGPRPRPLHCTALAWRMTPEHVRIAELLVDRGADVEQSVIADLVAEMDGGPLSAELMNFLRSARETFERRVPFDSVHPSGNFRARVCRRSDGLLVVETERWCVEDVPDHGMVWQGWVVVPGSVSVYADLEAARRDAISALEVLAAEAH